MAVAESLDSRVSTLSNRHPLNHHSASHFTRSSARLTVSSVTTGALIAATPMMRKRKHADSAAAPVRKHGLTVASHKLAFATNKQSKVVSESDSSPRAPRPVAPSILRRKAAAVIEEKEEEDEEEEEDADGEEEDDVRNRSTEQKQQTACVKLQRHADRDLDEEEDDHKEESDDEEEHKEDEDDDQEDEDDHEDVDTEEKESNATALPSKPFTSPAPSSSKSSSAIPSWESLGLVPALLEAVATVGWKTPTQIQIESLPYSLQGRDIIGLAETGSGKTGAFALPMLQSLLKVAQPYFGLVLAPTRELAFQIGEQIETLGSGIGVKVCVLVGGVDLIPQAIALAKKPHIIVATPGRCVDHLENTKGFSLRTLQYLILDEADRLLNMDFEREIDQILTVIPRQRNTMLFSATMTSKVAKLQRASLSDPVRVEVSKKYQTSAGLSQRYVFLPAFYKDVYLTFIVNEMIGKSMIVFAATCEHCQHVTLMLRHLGFSAIPLHGKMAQPKRLGALSAFKSGSMTILVATDVASRGLDIPTVDVVINYDIPGHSKDYIHRVGRTARAGRSGVAVTLVSQYDVELFQRIETLLGYKLEALEGVQNDKVMLMQERVSEAQRIAKQEMREREENKKERSGGGTGGRGRDDDGDFAGGDEVETDLKLGAKLSQVGRSRLLSSTASSGRGGRGRGTSGNRGGSGRGRGRGR